jgi:hypothetical protein
MTAREQADCLEAISKYQKGWDGYRAPAISPKVIQMTKAILFRLGDGWDVAPCPDGSVTLNFQEGDVFVSVDIDVDEPQEGRKA